MKNIQVIDGAVNCVYDIFAATDDEFETLFAPDTDIAFIDEIFANGDESRLAEVFNALWTRPVAKSEANGIHGTADPPPICLNTFAALARAAFTSASIGVISG